MSVLTETVKEKVDGPAYWLMFLAQPLGKVQVGQKKKALGIVKEGREAWWYL